MTPRRDWDVPEVRRVQSVPFSEINTSPATPTATNKPLPNATEEMPLVVCEFCGSHVLPSIDDKIVPLSPTATKVPFVYATSCKSACVTADTSAQVIPFDET